jgi:hypothetical protein
MRAIAGTKKAIKLQGPQNIKFGVFHYYENRKEKHVRSIERDAEACHTINRP